PKPGKAELEIIDLAASQALRTIPLGWNVSGMTLSKNGSYLLCVSQGKVEKKTDDDHGSVTIIDTHKNETVADALRRAPGVQAIVNQETPRRRCATPTRADENGGLDRFGKMGMDPSETEAESQLVLFEARVGNRSGRAYWNQQLLSPLRRMNTNSNV